MAKIFIKPTVAGHSIRFPDNLPRILKQEGEWVEHTPLWERKIMQGDVVKVEPPKEQLKEEKLKVSKEEQLKKEASKLTTEGELNHD